MLINKDLFVNRYYPKLLLDFKGFRLTANTNSLSILLEGFNKELNEWVCIVNEYDINNLIYEETGNDYEHNYNIILDIIDELYNYISEEYYKTEVLKHPRKQLISLNKVIIKIKEKVLYSKGDINEEE